MRVYKRKNPMPLPDLSKKNVTSRPIFESYFFSPLYRIPTISLRQSVTVFSNRISFFYHWTFFEQKTFCCVSSVFEKKSACPSMVYFLLGRILTNWSWMKKNWKQKKGKNKKTKIQKKNAFVIAQEILSVTKRFLQHWAAVSYEILLPSTWKIHNSWHLEMDHVNRISAGQR